MLITLPLYILRELCKAFAISLMIYTFVFLVMFCGNVVGAGVTIGTVVEIIPYMFPMMSRLVLPLSIITGIMISYGRFSANNEFIAAQASGIHPFWLGAPALVVAFFTAIITNFLNADVMTGAVVNMERRIIADRTNIINAKLSKPGSFSFKIPGSITFGICRLPQVWNGDKEGVGIDFTVFKQPGENKSSSEMWNTHYPYPEFRILAKNHKIDVTEDKDDKSMTIVGNFYDAILTSRLGKNIDSIQTMPYHRAQFVHPNTGFNLVFNSHKLQYMGIDKLKLVRKDYDNALSNVLRTEAEKLRNEIPELRQDAGLENELREAVLEGDPQELPEVLRTDEPRWQRLRAAAKWAVGKAIDTEAEINVKLVMSFACIFFAFFGIPLAMLGKRGSSTMGFAIGFGFAFIFYMVITALHGAVRDQELPIIALWIPNVVVFLVSGFLWYRMSRQLS